VHQKTYPTITTSRGVFARGIIMVKRQYGSRQHTSPPSTYIMENNEAAAWMNERIYLLWTGERRQVFQSRRAPRLPHSPASARGACHFPNNKRNVIITPDPRLSAVTPYRNQTSTRPRVCGAGLGGFPREHCRFQSLTSPLSLTIRLHMQSAYTKSHAMPIGSANNQEPSR
jgi:hypothetical protein